MIEDEIIIDAYFEEITPVVLQLTYKTRFSNSITFEDFKTGFKGIEDSLGYGTPNSYQVAYMAWLLDNDNNFNIFHDRTYSVWSFAGIMELLTHQEYLLACVERFRVIMRNPELFPHNLRSELRTNRPFISLWYLEDYFDIDLPRLNYNGPG